MPQHASSARRLSHVPVRALVFCVLVVAALGAIVGCGKPPYPLAEVHGRVTLDGRPLENAKVMFAPVAKGKSRKVGKPAFGLINGDGSFMLTTYQSEDGAVVGDHWVTVIRLREDDSSSPKDGEPRGYSSSWDRMSYPERLTVVAGKANEFTIALTSDMASQYGQVDH